MATIYTILDQLRRDEQRSVLATIIRVEGSAYRKEGTSMLFQENGTQIGMLSGGCLEQDLAVHAEEALSTGRSLTVMYDMSAEDDSSWGQGRDATAVFMCSWSRFIHGCGTNCSGSDYAWNKDYP